VVVDLKNFVIQPRATELQKSQTTNEKKIKKMNPMNQQAGPLDRQTAMLERKEPYYYCFSETNSTIPPIFYMYIFFPFLYFITCLHGETGVLGWKEGGRTSDSFRC
jgi:hypothetical protein